MKCLLKICGITNADDAQRAAGMGVSYLGFNFYRKSPRFIEPSQAKKIIADLPEGTIPVGLTAETEQDEIFRQIEQSGVRMIQLYTEPYVIVADQIPVPVIQAMPLTQLNNLNLPAKNIAMILVDSRNGSMLGGTGQTFEWSLIPSRFPREKLMLAGGITPFNIRAALRQVSPAVIDVASGAEKSPGIKDMEKIRLLIDALNEYNSEWSMNA